jgi:hypothetical protein
MAVWRPSSATTSRLLFLKANKLVGAVKWFIPANGEAGFDGKWSLSGSVLDSILF